MPPSSNIGGAVPDGLTVRLLTEDEAFARDQLSHLAFGVGRPDPERPRIVAPARRWGVLDPDGRLLAKATGREQRHWFGGHLVDASGVAGVAVAPEVRGRGLARLVAGLLSGPTDTDAVLDAAAAGPAPALLDFF